MIVSFSVSNFRSFATEETLSLVASKRLSGSHEDHAVDIPDVRERVLRTAVIYGANGAGKSNLFKALRYVEGIALQTRKRKSGTGRQQFRFADQPKQPSTFDLQFVAAGRLYQFGFKVDDDRISEEWLYQLVSGRQRVVYERLTDENGNVTIAAPGLDKGNAKLTALATVGGPPNQSFLSTVQLNLQSSDFGADLSAVLTWFKETLHLVGPEESFGALAHELSSNEQFLAFAGEFLRASSTGVDHLEVSKKEISEDQLKRLLPSTLVSRVLRDIEDNEQGFAVVVLGNGSELIVERGDENRYYQFRVQAAHEHRHGNIVRLDLNDESDGTQRLLNLIPALHHLRSSGAVFFIDEIDRSLHPILVRKFLEFFLQFCSGGHRQIIVTTHESSLLDQDLLRRDEIWFTEKDEGGATHLFSLLDFKVRNDLEIRKHYLQGRFGAVPFIGGFDRLLDEAREQR